MWRRVISSVRVEEMCELVDKRLADRVQKLSGASLGYGNIKRNTGLDSCKSVVDFAMWRLVF